MNSQDSPQPPESWRSAEPDAPYPPEPGPLAAGLFDSHCHLAFGAFDADRAEVVERARRGGVAGCVVVAVDGDSARAAQRLAAALPGWACPTAGIHPTEAAITDPAAWEDIEALIAEGGFAAVGETGLDAFHTGTSLDDQAKSMQRHLHLALDRHLPVILHCRDAFPRMVHELQRWRGTSIRGVLHCFTGTAFDLGPLLEAGLHIGVGGAATYRPNSALREAVREVPIDRLLLETDAPWLAPVPVRGRRNEPAFIAHVAAQLAADRDIPFKSLATATTANARGLFGV